MSFFSNLFSGSSNSVPPEEAAQRVAAGTALLIDVREADEWAETGVAEPALTLAMSEFGEKGGEWARVLEANKAKELLLYCHSGGRSGHIAAKLRSRGFRAANVGGFSDWARAGLPVRKL